MANHVSTMIVLTDSLAHLVIVQDLIDIGRSANPANQLLQLELDRRQSDVDRKRALLQTMITDIANRN